MAGAHKDHVPEKGQPNGLATLDAGGTVPVSQLPSDALLGVSFSMSVKGKLAAAPLPSSGLGPELVRTNSTLTNFRAERVVAGTSGTTTIQLEINRAVVPGVQLSWTPSDPDNAQKSVTISQAVVPGDVVSFRLLNAEVGAFDVNAKVSA